MNKNKKILKGKRIHKIAMELNQPKLLHIFNRDSVYSYREFKNILQSNTYQCGGGIMDELGSTVKNIFLGIINYKSKVEPQSKDILLSDKYSEVQVAYNDLAETFKNRFSNFSFF